MEFKELPHEVQVIASKCLADKINTARGFGEEAVLSVSAKEQGQQVRDAFIALFSEREFDGAKKAAAEKLASTILGLQQLVANNEIIKTQVGHVVSAADQFADKCL